MFKEKVRVQILEGKLTDKGKCLCGSYRGYEIMVNQMKWDSIRSVLMPILMMM